jgi:alpha-L-rhamnosidase
MTQQLFATEHVDWHAVWICHEADPHQTNMFVHFRNAFSVERLPEQATIHITADTAYKLWINGEEVGRGPAFSDPRWQSYDSHDVSNFLQAGTNVIAVLSYYYGQGVGEDVQTVNRPRPAGRMKRTVHDAMPGLLCQLEMSTGDERTCAVSDTSWKSLISKCWFADVAKIDDSTYSELYFAEREPGNWTAPDFDDTSWAGVTMRTGFIGDMYTGVDRVHAHVFPWCVLEPRQVPHVTHRDVYAKGIVASGEITETEVCGNENVALRMALEHIVDSEFTAIEKQDTLLSGGPAQIIPFDHNTSFDDFRGVRSTTIILDMGELMNGRVCIDVEVPAGAVIDIAYGQRLLENAKPEIYNSRISSADRYVTKDGRQQWTSFGWRHFRFVQITFRNHRAPLVVHSLKAVADDHPLEMKGSFTCSDEFLNWLWEAGVRTTRVQIHDDLVCSCNREKVQNAFDVAYNAESAITAFGDIPVVRRYFRNMLRSQTTYGFLSLSSGRPYECGLLFGSGEALMQVIWTHYERFGDRDVLQEAYLPVRRHVEFLNSFRGDDGLIGDQPIMLFQDWAEVDGDGKGKVLTLNARYAIGLRIAGWIARETGDNKNGAAWLGQYETTAASLNAKFWDDTRGAFVDYITPDDHLGEHISEHGNYMLMALGCVDTNRAKRIVECLRDPGFDIGQISPLQMDFLINGLCNYGYADYAMRVMRQRYGWVKDAGFDTIPESWKIQGARTWDIRGWKTMISRSAALMPGPVYGAGRWMLGVGPLVPGSDRIEIAPCPGDLEWARGSVPTARGDVAVSWKRDGDSFRLECELPDGVEGVVVLPFNVGDVAKITVDGAGGTAPDTDNGDKPMIPVSGHCVVECHLQML